MSRKNFTKRWRRGDEAGMASWGPMAPSSKGRGPFQHNLAHVSPFGHIVSAIQEGRAGSADILGISVASASAWGFNSALILVLRSAR